LNVTTQTIDDAAGRVSRYLGAQLIVNLSYGVPIGIGLYVIGLPNAALWGLLAVVLRFLPYIGPWIAAGLPLLLSIAVSPGWAQPITIAGLFIAVELITANVIEPWLYGSSTGLSPTAVVVSAVFWTWLWGPGGLLLATPLTVCLAVLGKHVPQLAFLDILLADKPPIAPEHRFYQRLLAGDETELYEIVSDYADRGALPELFEGVILPALHLTELDLASGNLTATERRDLHRYLREALATIAGFQFESELPEGPVIIVPMRSESDALAGAMLAHLLRLRGVSSSLLSPRLLTSEVQGSLANLPDAVVCASTFTGSGVRIASSLCKRLPQGTKILGYWLGSHNDRALRVPSGCQQVSTLEEAARQIYSKCGAPSLGDHRTVAA
jgi:hypothetical protein